MKPSLALFDFDGTITCRDTMFEFIKYCKGRWYFAIALVRLSPILLLHLLKIVSATDAKEALFSYYFKGMLAEDFNTLCLSFTEGKLPNLFNRSAVEKIEWHKGNGHRVVVVTASPENWLRYWCDKTQIEYIGTQLEIVEGRLTGRLSSRNCNGPEKAARIKQYLDLRLYEQVYAYGNTVGDKEMLELAQHRFYRSF